VIGGPAVFVWFRPGRGCHDAIESLYNTKEGEIMKIRHLAVGGVAAFGLLASAAGAATAGTHAPAAGPKFKIQENTIYAGWSAHPSGGVTDAAASWKVPTVQCNAPRLSRAWWDSRAGVWVGIWGADNNKNSQLAQVGTVSRCLDGHVHGYTAFAQDYPRETAQTLPSLQVKRGDEIHATVIFDSRVTSGTDKGRLKFFYSIADEADQNQPVGMVTGYLYSKPAQVKDGTNQGGAIVEAQPNGSTDTHFPLGGLANFGVFNFNRDIVNTQAMYLYPDQARTRWDMYNTVGKDSPGKEALAITGSATTSTGGEFPPSAGGLKITWKHWN
jgi:hypothetical protein